MARFEFAGPPRYRHQRQALVKLIETRGVCALLLEPGLGKTSVTLDYLSMLALKADPSPIDGVPEVRVLVAAPLAATDTWVLQAPTWVSPQLDFWAEVLGGSIRQKAEALASRGGQAYRTRGGALIGQTKGRGSKRPGGPFAERDDAFGVYRSPALDLRGGDPTDAYLGPRRALSGERPRLILMVTNLETFASRQSASGGTVADKVLDAVKRFRPHVAVVDELHKIKGVSSNTSRLLARVGEVVPRRIGLTGTVIPHSPLDVFAQWRFIEPTAFGDLRPDGSRTRATFTAFKARYAQLGGYMGREVVGFRRLDEMQAIMARNAVVARKEDALDLPPTTDVVVPVHLAPDEKRAYDEMKKQLAATLAAPAIAPQAASLPVSGVSTATAPNRLAQMMRLRQITAGHLKLDDGTLRDLAGSKARTVASIAHDTLEGESRIVVFAQFTREIQHLVAALDRAGTTVLTITGATPAEERLAIRRRFGDDSTSERLILVAQIKTISLAVNELVTASNAIFATLSQQRDDLIQARDRLNRIGQTRPMTFWYALAPGTVDEVVYKSHGDRTDLEAAVLRHIMDAA